MSKRIKFYFRSLLDFLLYKFDSDYYFSFIFKLLDCKTVPKIDDYKLKLSLIKSNLDNKLFENNFPNVKISLVDSRQSVNKII